MHNQLNASFSDFIASFDAGKLPSEAMSNLKVRIADLFESLRNLQRARKILGRPMFDKLPGLYFQSFLTNGQLDHVSLEKALDKSEKLLARQLGRHVVIYLRLLVELSKTEVKPKRGLLEVA